MRIHTAHVSLQYSDTNKQHTADIEKIFDRAAARHYAWIMGTEAGPGSGNTASALIRIGKEHDYKIWAPSEQAQAAGRGTDCWIAVRKDLIASGWKQGFVRVIPGSKQLYEEHGGDKDPDSPRWGPKGLVHVSFESIPALGEINLVATHHLTKAQKDGPASVYNGVDLNEWNHKLDVALGEYLTKAAEGSALGFASMDRNASDKHNPAHVPGMTTLADELKHWQNTGHGDIDWILSLNKDDRVKGHRLTVLNDREFRLNTDHFLAEGVFNVEPL